MSSFEDAILFIQNQATVEELIALSSAMKARRTFLNRSSIRQTRVGDVVEFQSLQGFIRGKVTAVMQKNVMVTTPTGRWRVGAHLLKQVNQEEA